MSALQPGITAIVLALEQGKALDGSIHGLLRDLGFETPDSAWRILKSLHAHTNFPGLYPDFFPAFLHGLASSFEPSRGLNNFQRFSEEIYDKNYLYNLLSTEPDLLSNLLCLFSGSQYLTDLLLKEPETFNWLQLSRAMEQSKLKDQLNRECWDLISACGTEEERYRAIRKFKKKEYLRIGLRDLSRRDGLEGILLEISNLADVLLQRCYEFSLAELEAKHGRPFFREEDGKEGPCEFCIIGMGKLGGRELNYSSDIDILYVYTSAQGATRPENALQRSISNHEFCTKLGARITAAMNKLTADGSVFRVDLGLRPEGSSGDIASSLRSYEIYYESWGRTWERMALLKARPCAGSLALGKTFIDMIRPFVFRKYLDFRALDEVKEMKEKITRETASSHATGVRNLKLGRGGIREIEFAAQVFSLIFGGKDKRIRENNLLSLLDKLSRHRYITGEDAEVLRGAYIFLREMEHRIQIFFGIQTQKFPREPGELKRLSLTMGMKGRDTEELCRRLEEGYARHTEGVHGIYNRLFHKTKMEESGKSVENLSVYEKCEIREEALAPLPFRDPGKVVKNLLLLRDGPPFAHPSSKSISQFCALLPRLLAEASAQPDPDQAIQNFARVVEHLEGRDFIYEMMGRSGETLSLLMTLFGSSEFLTNLLISQPSLLDRIFGPEWVARFKPIAGLSLEIEAALAGDTDLALISDKLRTFKRAEEMRVGLRYLLKKTSYKDMCDDLSALACLYLRQVLKILLDFPPLGPLDPSRSGFAIIGMGKLGGRELHYGSDLDVIFVYDESREPQGRESGSRSPREFFSTLAESICKMTSRPTRAGLTYNIDTGLRPEGEKGPLATSLQGLSEYLGKRAAVWERQSLIKARFIAGDRDVSGKFFRLAHGFVYGGSVSLASIAEIRRLRKRVEREGLRKARGRDNIKHGPGGLMDIEFIVQLLQLRYGHLTEKIRSPSTLAALDRIRSLGYLDPADCDLLSESYLFLRRVITVMRMNGEWPSEILPGDPAQLRKLSLGMGYGRENESPSGGREKEAPDFFLKECRDRMRKVRRIYDRVFTIKTGRLRRA